MKALHILSDRKRIVSQQRGFTVIELTIATLIFSLILILLIDGVLQITRNYYKGITSSNTQNAARNILNNISQTIQFGGAVPQVLTPLGNGVQGFCAGNQLFSYLPGFQLVSGTAGSFQANYVFIQSTLSGNCGPGIMPQDLRNGSVPSGTELMGVKMRLSSLTIVAPVPPPAPVNLYKVGIRVVYGDNDLLCSPSVPYVDCDKTIDNFTIYPAPPGKVPTDLSCKGQAGGQFCAVSDLSTIVENRLQ